MQRSGKDVLYFVRGVKIMKSIRLDITDDINLENLVDILKNAGINAISATEMKDCLELGFYEQDDLSDLVYSVLEDKNELKNCSEEQLYELSKIIAKKIPDEMYTSGMEDQIHESVYYAINDYVSYLDLKKELKQLRNNN